MVLKDLIIEVNDKKGVVEISGKGLRIKALEKDFTTHELQYLVAVSFIYLGSQIYEKDYAANEVMERGHKMYEKYSKKMGKGKLNGGGLEGLFEFK